MQLPDINVWLALTSDSHLHHPSAKNWFDGLTTEVCFFCRMTQQGCLRLATNAAVFGPHALTLAEAWHTLHSDVRIAYADEPVGLEVVWRSFTQHRSFSPKVWNDAYLAAFAQTGGYQIVTFDQALAPYTGVAVLLLP